MYPLHLFSTALLGWVMSLMILEFDGSAPMNWKRMLLIDFVFSVMEVGLI